MTMHLSSPAFTNGQAIPAEHTCDGRNDSPPLRWTGVPDGTVSFALTCDDPDAPGGWVHWILYNLPATTRELSARVPAVAQLPDGAAQGISDFKRPGYGGPCPPPGKHHRYFFKLHALDSKLTLKPGATKPALLEAMKPHLLAAATVMGTYGRR
jgi:Raf kinase inhibitor-like YbhB/YbcL family protein